MTVGSACGLVPGEGKDMSCATLAGGCSDIQDTGTGVRVHFYGKYYISVANAANCMLVHLSA